MERFYKAFVDHFNTKPTSILEIGSRDGLHAEWLRKLGDIPENLVNLVEPHPISFRNMVNNFPNAKSFNLAVSDEPGVLRFNAIPDTYNIHVMGCSSIKEVSKIHDPDYSKYPPPNWIKVLAVTGRTILKLIDRWEIDLIKIDVEGLTYEVLKSFGPDIRLLKSLHIEVEMFELWEGQHQYDEIQSYLKNWGFQEMYYQPAFWGGLQGDNVWVRID